MGVIVLRSPVYFIFLLLCCAAAYVVHTLNLWGPILRVTNAMGQQAVDIGKVCIIHRVCAFLRREILIRVLGTPSRFCR